MEFMSDLLGGFLVRMSNVVDDFNWECLTLYVYLRYWLSM